MHSSTLTIPKEVCNMADVSKNTLPQYLIPFLPLQRFHRENVTFKGPLLCSMLAFLTFFRKHIYAKLHKGSDLLLEQLIKFLKNYFLPSTTEQTLFSKRAKNIRIKIYITGVYFIQKKTVYLPLFLLSHGGFVR